MAFSLGCAPSARHPRPAPRVGGGASTPRKCGTRILLLASQAEVSRTLRLSVGEGLAPPENKCTRMRAARVSRTLRLKSKLFDLRVAKSNLIARANNTQKRKTRAGELGSKPCHGAKRQGSICYPVFLAAALGFEPRDDGVRVRCLTAWRCRNTPFFQQRL